MITLCENTEEFLNICDKVKLVKDARLTENILYNAMISGLYNNQVFTYTSYDNEMNGCLVLLSTKDQIGESALVMLFVWINAHYPKLHKEFIDIATQKAKELKVKKINIVTNRKEEAILRRIGKYGFKKVASIFEKEVDNI